MINAVRTSCGLAPFVRFKTAQSVLQRNACPTLNLDTHHTLYHTASAIHLCARPSRTRVPTSPPPPKPASVPPPPAILPGTYSLIRPLLKPINALRASAGLPTFRFYASLFFALVDADCARIQTADTVFFRSESATELALALDATWDAVPPAEKDKVKHLLTAEGDTRSRLTRLAQKHERSSAAQRAHEALVRKKAEKEREKTARRLARARAAAEARTAQLYAPKTTVPSEYVSSAKAHDIYNAARRSLGRFPVSYKIFQSIMRRIDVHCLTVSHRNYYLPEDIAAAVHDPATPRPFKFADYATADDLASGLYMPASEFAQLTNIHYERVLAEARNDRFPSLVNPANNKLLIHAACAAQRFIALANYKPDITRFDRNRP